MTWRWGNMTPIIMFYHHLKREVMDSHTSRTSTYSFVSMILGMLYQLWKESKKSRSKLQKKMGMKWVWPQVTSPWAKSIEDQNAFWAHAQGPDSIVSTRKGKKTNKCFSCSIWGHTFDIYLVFQGLFTTYTMAQACMTIGIVCCNKDNLWKIAKWSKWLMGHKEDLIAMTKIPR